MTGQQIMDSLIISFVHITNAIPFSSSTWVVIFTLLFFVLLFAKASRDQNSLVNWEHLIVETSTNRASPYKVGYLVGILVSTWMVLRIADTGNLNLEIFGAYLTYLLGGASVNIFKSRSKNDDSGPAPADEPK
jgi:hypothetical protein